jgi:hypothetical protein
VPEDIVQRKNERAFQLGEPNQEWSNKKYTRGWNMSKSILQNKWRQGVKL